MKISTVHISQIAKECIRFNDGDIVEIYPCKPNDLKTRENLVDDRILEYTISKNGYITFVKRIEKEWKCQ